MDLGSWSEVQHDLYFTVQCFCLISLRLLDVCTSYFRNMNQYHPTFDLKINLSHCDLYFMVIVPYILKTISCMNIIIWDSGWLGWAMVMGSFQCRGVLLLSHIVEQGPALLAAGVGRVGYIFYIFHLSSLSNVLSFGRWLNMAEILWFRLLNPNSSCQWLPRTSKLSTG